MTKERIRREKSSCMFFCFWYRADSGWEFPRQSVPKKAEYDLLSGFAPLLH